MATNPLQVEETDPSEPENNVIVGEIVQSGPKKPGRPSKFGAVLVKKVLSELDAGLPFDHACALAGIHPTTGKKYLMMGMEDPDSAHGEFALEVYKRKAQYMKGLIEEWRDTASMTKQWAGLATLAERLDPENFSQKKNQNQVNVQVNVGNFEKKLHEIASSTQVSYDGG